MYHTKFSVGVMVGFVGGLVFALINWYTSPREFNERNTHNMIMQECIQVLENSKTLEKEKK